VEYAAPAKIIMVTRIAGAGASSPGLSVTVAPRSCGHHHWGALFGGPMVYSVVIQVVSVSHHRPTGLSHDPAAPPLRADGLAGSTLTIRFWLITAIAAAVGIALFTGMV